jgi:hypothetical protein
MEYLYLIRCNTFVKIGITNDIDYRLRTLQTGNPYPLAVLATFEFANALPIESRLHKKYSRFRVRGEWFELTDEQVSEIRDVCSSGEICKEHPVSDVEFAVLALESAISYCIEAGLHVEISNHEGSLVLVVDGVEYSESEQCIRVLESVGNA